MVTRTFSELVGDLKRRREVGDQSLTIGTAEFWKASEGGRAFELMYAQTKYELQECFEEDTNPNWIRMTVVSHLGECCYFDQF